MDRGNEIRMGFGQRVQDGCKAYAAEQACNGAGTISEPWVTVQTVEVRAGRRQGRTAVSANGAAAHAHLSRGPDDSTASPNRWDRIGRSRGMVANRRHGEPG